jgi:cell division septum initiation protein DivIVA
MRTAAAALLEDARAKSEQMNTDLEVKLAARREEAERLDAERHDQAVGQATQLVAEAEQRASAAEQRASKAVEQAEAVRRDADEHAKSLVGNARRNADQVIAEARAHADKVLSEAKGEADRNRRAAQRQVDELIRQRDSITGHLDQLRALLGNTMPVPGLDKLAAAAARNPQDENPEPAKDSGERERTIVLPDRDPAGSKS